MRYNDPMKEIGLSTKIFILLITFLGCERDVEQAKRYSEMKSECDSLIAQANLVAKYQRAKADSLRKIRDDGLAVKTPEYKLLRIEREITDAVEIETNIIW